jgi:tetratricopeptide (TPR) repeat protein
MPPIGWWAVSWISTVPSRNLRYCPDVGSDPDADQDPGRRGIAMYRMALWAAAALLAAIVVQPATADDDASVCESGRAHPDAPLPTDDERIEACTRLLAVTYYHRAGRYIHKGDFDHAIADLDQAIGIDPQFAGAYYNRGMTYDYKHDYDRAIADFDQALKLNPKNYGSYFSRGDLYLDKGDYDRAIADFDEAIRRFPEAAFTYDRRGEAYFRKGDYDRTIADANEAIRLVPQDADAYYTRGEAYEAKNDLDHAIADFDEALKLAQTYYTGDVEPLLAKARQARERVQALKAKPSDGARINPPPR